MPLSTIIFVITFNKIFWKRYLRLNFRSDLIFTKVAKVNFNRQTPEISKWGPFSPELSGFGMRGLQARSFFVVVWIQEALWGLDTLKCMFIHFLALEMRLDPRHLFRYFPDYFPKYSETDYLYCQFSPSHYLKKKSKMYMPVVSSGGKQSNRRKSPPIPKSLTTFLHAQAGISTQTLVRDHTAIRAGTPQLGYQKVNA